MLASQSQAASPRLDVRVSSVGFDEQATLGFEGGEVCIGRSSLCDVVLPSESVSRRHVLISRTASGLLVRDVSSHGTVVDGLLTQGEATRVGEQVELGVGPYVLSLRVIFDAKTSGEADRIAPAGHAQGVSSEVRRRLRNLVLESMDLVSFERSKMEPHMLRPVVEQALERAASSLGHEVPGGVERKQLLLELGHEILGLGPLEPLLADPKISEIMVVDPETIYVERDGCVELSTARFTDDSAVRSVLERIVTPLGRRIDESNPMVDARLGDGSRVNAVIPPLALKGPAITIRRFPARPLDLETLIAAGALSRGMADFLEKSVKVRVNTVISGGTGSGKTTLLNVLSAAIPERERIVTIEDAAELRLNQRHVVSLESRVPNMEGQGAVTIRDLVRNALRMRPDRIIVGECRGGEALDMLQAMNTGHDGSMTTTHANNPREAVQRLETLCLMSGLDLPITAVRRQIATSLELVIQQARFSDGSRRITHISEVVGLSEAGEVEIRDVFRFLPSGIGEGGRVLGDFVASGSIPTFVERFIANGFEGAMW